MGGGSWLLAFYWDFGVVVFVTKLGRNFTLRHESKPLLQFFFFCRLHLAVFVQRNDVESTDAIVLASSKKVLDESFFFSSFRPQRTA